MSKADQATHLLRDDFFKEEIEKIKQSCLENIMNSDVEDIQMRENSYNLFRAVNLVVSHFESIAAQNKIDEKRWKIF